MLSNEDSVQPKTEKKKKEKRLQGVMKSQENITQPKYYNNLSVTNPKMWRHAIYSGFKMTV